MTPAWQRREAARTKFLTHRTDAAWDAWREAEIALDVEEGINAWGEELPGEPFDFCRVMAEVMECAMQPFLHGDTLSLAVAEEFNDEMLRWRMA